MLGADAGEEQLGGLVGRVLGDELAAEGSLEDGTAERRYRPRSLLSITHMGEERPRWRGNLL